VNILTPKGSIIRCENGHPMGYSIRDVKAGEVGTWGDAFLWGGDIEARQGGTPLAAGSEFPRCDKCKAIADFMGVMRQQ